MGTADGFTTYLRKKFQNNYSGIEIEINQKFSRYNKMETAVKDNLRCSFTESYEIKNPEQIAQGFIYFK